MDKDIGPKPTQEESMASKKSKTSTEKSQPNEQPSTSGASTAEQAAETPSTAPTQPEPPAQGRSKVSKGVFYVGIGLALVLGLYVGSLVPSLFAPDAQTPAPGNAPKAQSAPAAPQPAAQAQQEALPPMPPELKAKIAAKEQAVLANPKSAENWTELGNLYFDTGQSHKAISSYERSLAIAPDNADVLTDLGIMYREAGEFEKAVTTFRRASSVNPRHENAMFNEGVVLYFDLKRRDDAMKAWQRLLAVNPGARAPDGQTVSEVIKNLR